MNRELDGHAAVVTGAGKGIGRAIVASLQDAGASVLGVDNDESALLKGDGGFVPLVADVRTDADGIMAEAIRLFGRIDSLCNNAGVMDGYAAVADVDFDAWDRVLEINLTAPARLAKAAMPYLVESRGVVVNLASTASLGGSHGGAAYTSSKHGLLGLTRHIAALYGPLGVRALAICPGPVATGMDPGGSPSGRALDLQKLRGQMGTRIGTPDEIAAVVRFAVSPGAAYMNGVTIVVDGGLTAM